LDSQRDATRGSQYGNVPRLVENIQVIFAQDELQVMFSRLLDNDVWKVQAGCSRLELPAMRKSITLPSAGAGAPQQSRKLLFLNGYHAHSMTRSVGFVVVGHERSNFRIRPVR
jgi:hypothetical protein